MSHINDDRLAFFLNAAVKASGHINDEERDWYLAQLQPYTGPTQINDLWQAFWIAEGIAPGHVNDMAYDWLIAQGITPGHISDMWSAYFDRSAVVFRPLTHSLLDGYGPDMTFSRNSPAMLLDHQGVMRTSKANEPSFAGARRVENVIETPALGNWTIQSGAVGIDDLGAGEFRFNIGTTINEGIFYVDNSITSKIGATVVLSLEMRSETVDGIVNLNDPAGNSGIFKNANVTTNWSRFRVSGTIIADDKASGAWVRFAAGGLSSVLVRNIQNETTSGQLDVDTPSEYVSRGVLSAPFHGANIDAVKWFNTKNSVSSIRCLGDSFISIGTYNTQIDANLINMFTHNHGIGGDTLADLDARFDTDVTPYDPTHVFIHGGVNELVVAVADPLASMQASIQSMETKALASDIIPIFCTVGPFGNNAGWNADRETWTLAYNAWIRSYCAINGYVCIDEFITLVDQATSFDLLAVYDSSDGLHPNTAGYTKLGIDFVAQNGDTLTNRALVSTGSLRGIMVEEETTNICLWSRDLSNAVWTPTNMTVARDQIGADGVPNRASSIAATAANATVLQTIGGAVTVHSGSAYVKRLSGSGAIDITIDGSTWVPITVTNEWTRVRAGGIAASPIFGLRVATSGDSIAVDYSQAVAENFSTSSVETEAVPVSRQPAVLEFPSAGTFKNEEGTVVMEYTPFHDQPDATGNTRVFTSDAITSWFYYHGAAKRLTSYDGTTVIASTLVHVAGIAYNCGFRWNAVNANMQFYIDGTPDTGGIYDGNWVDSGTINLGGDGGVGAIDSCTFKNVKMYLRELSDAEMASETSALGLNKINFIP